jgi:phosphoglycerate dehydrogenase-like enzyme
MKNDAFLINTSRGDLVDNIALHNALLNGSIAGAGLDVIAPEPVEKDNILLDERIKDKLILTPHIAGITNLTVKKIYGNIWDNITRFMNGKPLRNRVN